MSCRFSQLERGLGKWEAIGRGMRLGYEREFQPWIGVKAGEVVTHSSETE